MNGGPPAAKLFWPNCLNTDHSPFSSARTKEMHCLHLALTPLVGAPTRICRAIEMHDGFKAHFAVLDATAGAYDRMVFDFDLQWSKNRDEIVALAETADVIHLHNYLGLTSSEFAPIDLQRLWDSGRPMVRHFHSTPDNVANYMRTTRSAIFECPIPKLVIPQYPARFFPTAKIVPNIILNAGTYVGGVTRGEAVRIGYAPTRFNSGRSSRWDTKGYIETKRMLNAVMARSTKQRQPVEVDIIEQVSHQECLRRKSACHIVVDDLVTGSYHLNTLESLAAGSVCLTYMDRTTQQAVFDLTGRSDFPALSVGLEDAEEVLVNLVSDRRMVEALGEHSRLWMAQHWAPKSMARHFLDAYAHVMSDPRKPFLQRRDTPLEIQQWTDVELNDLVWANRKHRWPRIMPNWLRILRSSAGQMLHNLGMK